MKAKKLFGVLCTILLVLIVYSESDAQLIADTFQFPFSNWKDSVAGVFGCGGYNSAFDGGQYSTSNGKR